MAEVLVTATGVEDRADSVPWMRSYLAALDVVVSGVLEVVVSVADSAVAVDLAAGLVVADLVVAEQAEAGSFWDIMCIGYCVIMSQSKKKGHKVRINLASPEGE